MNRNRAILCSLLINAVICTSAGVFALGESEGDGSVAMTGANIDGNVGEARVADVGYTGPVPETPATFSSGANPVTVGDASYALGRSPGTKYGIFYLVWHCLAGHDHWNMETNLGPPLTYSWHGEPAVGYYCPTENRDILRQHAAQIRDAGFDFVFVDLTNFDGSEEAAQLGARDPFQALVEEWSKIKGAPKIVPWVPFRNGGSLAAWVDALFSQDQYKGMLFNFKGKPLFLTLASYLDAPDPNLVALYSSKYTVRTMWIWPPDKNQWDFVRACQNGFKDSGGTIECNQPPGLGPDGSIEQLSTTAAYSQINTSDTGNPLNVPKFGGLTLHQQLATIEKLGEPPIVTVTGWNEWIAYRYCYSPTVGLQTDCVNGAPTLPNGNPVFVDQWIGDYNRDMEPGADYGDKYYQQLITEILGRKRQKSQIIGYVDTVTRAGDGSAIVTGWACTYAYPTSVQVELYANGPAGVGELVATGTADQNSEEPVGLACSDGWQGNHRFALAVSAEKMARLANQTVYVRGISPIGGTNFLLANSGSIDFTGKSTGSSLLTQITSSDTAQIYRFRSPGATPQHFYTASYQEGTSAGFVYEGVAFSVVPAGTPGTIPVYRCWAGGNYISAFANCEGNQTVGTYGGLYKTAGNGRLAIYRMVNASINDHLQTANIAEGLANGYTLEGPLGFAPP